MSKPQSSSTKPTSKYSPVRVPIWHTADALSDTAAKYGAMLADPFHKECAVGMPSEPALFSRKTTVWSQGTFQTGSGANNFGFVAFDPRPSLFNDGVKPCIWKSTSSYAGSTIAVSGIGVDTAASNSDYSYAQLTAGAPDYASARLVAAGVRVWYSGELRSLGGDIAAEQTANHTTLVGYGFADVLADTFSRRFVPKMGSRYGCTYVPAVPAELGYQVVGNPFNTSAPYMAVVVNGATTAALWSYEAYAHWEIVGTDVRGKTRSIMDPVGMAAALSIANSGAGFTTTFASPSPIADPVRAASWLDRMGNYVLRGASGAARIASMFSPPLVNGALQVASMGLDIAADKWSTIKLPPPRAPLALTNSPSMATVSELLADGTYHDLERVYAPVA